jgi:hypothetical protein
MLENGAPGGDTLCPWAKTERRPAAGPGATVRWKPKTLPFEPISDHLDEDDCLVVIADGR